MLSILIPTYNYNVIPLVKVLHAQCTASIIPFEIIVADDSPGSVESMENKKITALSGCRFIQNETNLGRTHSRKKLAENAVFDNLLFLDADVIPVSDSFIKTYIPYLNKDTVVLGGVAYEAKVPEQDKILRYKYGIYREQKDASVRNQNRYGSVLSANLLVSKNVFITYNYNPTDKLYGMDNFFAYNLYKENVAVVHIDNPVYHLGLEDNRLFFQKCLESANNRRKMLTEAEGIENINSLLRRYTQLKKYGLTTPISILFRMSEPFLKRMILKKDPNLFCLDIYRLGYICSIK